MLPSPFKNRRLWCVALVWPCLLVSWATLSSSSSFLQVATDDLVIDSADDKRTDDAPVVNASTSDGSPLQPLPSTSSSYEDVMKEINTPSTAKINTEDAATLKSPVTTSDDHSSVENNDTNTTTTNPLFPLEFSRWKLPPAWTAPWNDTSNEDEIDYRQYEDEKTYLDMFGELAKEFLTQRVIPSTDTECDWNWKHLRCEPYCHCEVYPMWGDYHIGRTCRRGDGLSPPHRTTPPPSNASSTTAPSPPPAMSPCEFDDDLPSPLLRVQKLLQDQLHEVTPIVKSVVDRWQLQLQQLLHSPESIKAQRTVLTWLRVANYKLYKWQTQACADVPCLTVEGDDDDDDKAETAMNLTKPADAATASSRPPGPWAWSQRFLCDKLPFSDKCNNSNHAGEGQRMFPWPPKEEYYFDARPETAPATENSSSQQPMSDKAGTPQPPPAFHRFTGWAKKD